MALLTPKHVAVYYWTTENIYFVIHGLYITAFSSESTVVTIPPFLHIQSRITDSK